ncbi:MAG: hypothetical protein U0840_20955 [Gemmataceae bacterium]
MIHVGAAGGMNVLRYLTGLVLVVGISLVHGEEPTPDTLKKKPITTHPGEIGKLLRQWYADGSAAGNVGDWYDNRDGDHSPLNLTLHPQLRKVAYSAEDIKARRHWALQPRLLPHVVFGNSSTSAPPTTGGSNVRMYYCSARGLDVLQQHYLHNNLYIYPEHRDHDPGHNGVGDGFGDLYPTNTPYLLTSQGSSGSDQPFMHAVPYTLAALRPAVKKKLVDAGLLMPTVQMILRATGRNVKTPEDYYTGAAHPTVFEGSNVDPLAMIRLGHGLTADSLPPLVKLKVIEETKPVRGRDYHDPEGITEQLGDTVGVIARIWRGKDRQRKLVVSAEDSVDLNNLPLTFRWVVLRGDPDRVRITPRDKAGRVAEIEVQYHERRPIAPGSAMASNRVDIGVFAHNGKHPSPPAFVTFFSLDSEGRAYDEQGKIREIGHGMGSSEVKVPDEARLCEHLARDESSAAVLKLTTKEREALGEVAPRLAGAARLVETRRKTRQEAEMARNKATGEARQAAEKTLATASLALTEAEKAHQRLLDEKHAGLGAGPRVFLQTRLKAALAQRDLWNLQRERFGRPEKARARAALDAAGNKLVQLGIIRRDSAGSHTVLATSPFASAMLEEFQARLLAELIGPDLLRPVFHANFIDPRLAIPKAWRDVYSYQGERLTGWTRYTAEGPPQEYTAEGWLVTARDDKGRPEKARPVEYRLIPARVSGLGKLAAQPTDDLITFRYDGDTRLIQAREKVPVSKESP